MCIKSTKEMTEAIFKNFSNVFNLVLPESQLYLK